MVAPFQVEPVDNVLFCQVSVPVVVASVPDVGKVTFEPPDAAAIETAPTVVVKFPAIVIV